MKKQPESTQNLSTSHKALLIIGFVIFSLLVSRLVSNSLSSMNNVSTSQAFTSPSLQAPETQPSVNNWTFTPLNLQLGQSALVVPPGGDGFRVSVDSAIIQRAYSYTDNTQLSPSTFVSYAEAGEVYYLFNFTEENASSSGELFFVQNFRLQGADGSAYNATTFWLNTNSPQQKSGTMVFEAPVGIVDPEITYSFGYTDSNSPVNAVWALDKQAITPAPTFEVQMAIGQNATFNNEDGLGDYTLSLTGLAYSSDAPGGLAYATFQVYHGQQEYTVQASEGAPEQVGPSLELSVTGAKFVFLGPNAPNQGNASSISVRLEA